MDVSNLELDSIGTWPAHIRAIVVAGVCILVLGGGYALTVPDALSLINRETSNLRTLKNDFKTKYHKAANLDAYKQQLSTMESAYRSFLQQLPKEAKVPELIDQISKQAFAGGLTYKSIVPGKPTNEGFYYELPLELTLTGSYHGIGLFVSGVAALPRIVTLHDFSVSSKEKKAGGSDDLELKITVKTYWDPTKETD